MLADSLIITDPGAVRYLLLIPVIVILYMIGSRYRRRSISSTMLWRGVRRDMEARQRLRWPPLSLLMLLQLIAVGIGAAALAKPALPAQNRTHLVLLVDTSASMEAADVAPSRFAVALQHARQAISQIQPGDQVSLVELGSTPRLMASGTGTTEVLAALDHLRPGSAMADVDAGLQLADHLIGSTGGHGVALLLSDGAFGTASEPRTISVPVSFEPIGTSGDNQAITSMDVRPDMDSSGRWSAFVRVVNYSDRPVDIGATATADGLLLNDRRLQLAPNGVSDLSFGLPPGTRAFAFTLDTGDSFQGDDQAELQLDLPQPRSVLLVSNDGKAIEKVLQTMPGLKVSTILPGSYVGEAGADLVILDGFIPLTLPNADLLLMNPPPDAPGFPGAAVPAEASVLRSRQGSPLIESVDLQSLRLAQIPRLETPDWAHAVVEGQEGALILQGERLGRKVVVFDFDWLLHDLPRMQAFPLLLSNAVAQLSPTALPRSLRPGESLSLRPMADATEATVEMPDGSQRHLSLEGGTGSFGDTEQVGRYAVRWRGPNLGEVSSSFNVNLTSEAESKITPRDHVLGQGFLTRGSVAPVPGLQLWPFAALLLLGVLMLEWTYFSRRS